MLRVAFLIIIIFFAAANSAYAEQFIVTPPDVDFKTICVKKNYLTEDDFNWSNWNPEKPKLTDKQLYNRAYLYYNGSATTLRNLPRAKIIVDSLVKKKNNLSKKAKKMLADMYLYGNGVAQDTNKAKDILKSINDSSASVELARIYEDEGNFIKAKKYFKQAAAKGNPSAAVSLAYLYEQGKIKTSDKNTKQSLDYAQSLLLEEIAAGNCAPLAAIGAMYLKLKNIKNNEVIAAKWYEAASKTDNINAKLKLANLYINGLGAEFDYNKIINLWQEAATLGSSEAMHLLGKNYVTGGNEPQNLELAITWLTNSAKRQNIKAMELLAELYNGKYGAVPDYKKYFYFLSEIAKLPNANNTSLFMLAKAYEENIGTETNQQKAIELYSKAAKQGNRDAIIKLGDAYRYGKGFEKNPIKALKFYRLAASKGSIPAIYAMQKTYECGIGKQPDNKKAQLWFNRAFYRNSPEALLKKSNLLLKNNPEESMRILKRAIKVTKNPKTMVELGLRYYEGNGINQDKSEAQKLFDKVIDAAKQNNNYEGVIVIARAYFKDNRLEKNLPKATKLLEMAEQSGDIKAIYELGKLFIDNGDHNKAIKYIEKAADENNINAMFLMAEAYGEDGWHRENHTLAKKWIDKALDNHPCSPQNILKITKIYSKGKFGIKADKIKAAKSIKKLSKMKIDNANTMFEISKILLNSYEEENISRAIELLKKSANLGNADSMVSLANIYLSGHGITQSTKNGIFWLEKSGNKGNKEAQDKLNRFRKINATN